MPYQIAGPHFVHVATGAAGRALYVGVTNRLARRLLAHERSSWWSLMRRLDVEEFTDRQEAERRELDLIDQLKPQFNGTDGRWRARERQLLALHMAGMTWAEAVRRLRMSRNATRLVRRRLQRTGQAARTR